MLAAINDARAERKPQAGKKAVHLDPLVFTPQRRQESGQSHGQPRAPQGARGDQAADFSIQGLAPSRGDHLGKAKITPLQAVKAMG